MYHRVLYNLQLQKLSKSLQLQNVYVPRERLPFSALNFRSGAYHFHIWQKYSAPEHGHFTFFAVPETII